jgi:chromosome segregation ATPase
MSKVCISDLERKLGNQNDQIAVLKSECERAFERLQSREKELTDLLSIQQQKYQIEMDSRASILDRKEGELNRLNSLILELKPSYETKTVEVESVVKQITTEICNDLGSKLSWFDGMDKNIKSWKKELKSRKDKLKEFAIVTEKIRLENETLRTLNDISRKENEAMNEKLESSTSEKDQELYVLQENIKSMEIHQERISAENDEFKAQISLLNEKVATSIGLKEDMTIKMEEGLKLIQGMETDLSHKDSLIEQLKFELQDKELLATSLTEKLHVVNSSIVQHQSNHDDQIRVKQKEVIRLKEDVAVRKAEFELAMKEIYHNTADFLLKVDEKIFKNTEFIASIKSAMESQEKRMSKLNQTIARVWLKRQKENDESMENIRRLDTEIRKCHLEISELNSQIDGKLRLFSFY